MISIFNETKQTLKSVERKRGDILLSMTKEEDNKKKNISILFQPSNEKEKTIFKNLNTFVNMEKVETLLELEDNSKLGVSYDLKHFSQTIRTDFKNQYKDILFLTLEIGNCVLSDILPSKGVYIHNYFFFKGTFGAIVSLDKDTDLTIKFFNEENKTMLSYTFKKENNKYSVNKENTKVEEGTAVNRFKIRRYVPLRINKVVLVHESNVEELKNLNVVDEKIKTLISFKDMKSLSGILEDLKTKGINVATLYLPIESYRDSKYTKEMKELTKSLSENFVVFNVLMNDGKVKRR